MLRIIDRYMLRELAGPFGFGIILFAALMIGTILLSDVLRTLQRYDLSLWLILKYLALSAPKFLILCIPMGTLLGTLIAVGRLNSDHEIVALRATGLGLYRVLLPFLVVGCFLAGLTILGNELIVPVASTELVEMKNDLRSGKFGGQRERVSIPIAEGGRLRWLLIAGSMQGTALRDVVLIYFDPTNWRNDTVVQASEGHWRDGRWDFRDMELSLLSSSGKAEGLRRVESEEVRVPDFEVSPRELEAKRLAPDDVAARQLRDVIADLLANQARLKVDPRSVQALHGLHLDIAEDAQRAQEKDRTILPLYEDGELQWVLVADDTAGDVLHNVQLFHFDSQNPEENYAMYAARGVWQGRRGWQFHELRRVLIDPENEDEPVVKETASGRVPGFKLGPEDLAMHTQAIEDKNAEQLLRYIHELQLHGGGIDERHLRQLYTELHFKYAIPLTPLFFIWIAFPLAIMPQRASNTRGMGIALLIILIYMASVALFKSMGTSGVVPPLLAAWVPNLVLGLTGWRLMQKRQHS